MKNFKVDEDIMVPARIKEVRHGFCDLECEEQMLRIATSRLIEFEEEKETEKTYEDGLNDAWEVCRKFCCESEIGGLSDGALKEIFGSNHLPSDIFMDYTAQDAIDKIKAWEDANAIRVGDIIEVNGGVKGLVTKIKDGCYYIIFSDGSCRKTNEGETVKKTGRNADISSYLFGIFGV